MRIAELFSLKQILDGVAGAAKASYHSYDESLKKYNQNYTEISHKHYGDRVREAKSAIRLTLAKFKELKASYKGSTFIRHQLGDWGSSDVTKALFKEAKICGSDDAKRGKAVLDYMLDFTDQTKPGNHGLGFRQFLWEQVAEHDLLKQLLPEEIKETDEEKPPQPALTSSLPPPPPPMITTTVSTSLALTLSATEPLPTPSLLVNPTALLEQGQEDGQLHHEQEVSEPSSSGRLKRKGDNSQSSQSSKNIRLSTPTDDEPTASPLPSVTGTSNLRLPGLGGPTLTTGTTTTTTTPAPTK